MTSWPGLFAPAGTPQPILGRLADETLVILVRPEIRQRLAVLGFEVDPLGREQFGLYVREQLAYWGKLVRVARIEPE